MKLLTKKKEKVKSSSIKSKKNKRIKYRKNNLKGGAPDETEFSPIGLLNDKSSNNSKFEQRFNFFPFAEPDREENLYKEMTSTYSILDSIEMKRHIVKDGRSQFKGKLVEQQSSILASKAQEQLFADYGPLFYKKMEDLYQRIFTNQPKPENTEIIFHRSHGGIDEDPEYFKVPENSYICFMAPIGNTMGSEFLRELPHGLANKIVNMSPKDFDNIVEYLAGLGQHTKGVANRTLIKKNKSDYLMDKRYADAYLDCFQNSTWYYPGQTCIDLILSLYESDFDKSKTRFLNEFSTYHITKEGKKIKTKINAKKEVLIELLKGKTKEIKYRLSKLVKYRKGKKYKIYILYSCRSSNYNIPKFLFKYETFVHHINVKLFEKLNSVPDEGEKKICLEENSCVYSSDIIGAVTIKDRVLLKKNLNNQVNSNFSRFTSNLVRIYQNIEKNIKYNEIYFQTEEFKNDLRFIGGLSIKLITDFFIKLQKDFGKKKKNFIKNMILDFVEINHFKLMYFLKYLKDYYFLLIYTKGERDRFSIYNKSKPKPSLPPGRLYDYNAFTSYIDFYNLIGRIYYEFIMIECRNKFLNYKLKRVFELIEKFEEIYNIPIVKDRVKPFIPNNYIKKKITPSNQGDLGLTNRNVVYLNLTAVNLDSLNHPLLGHIFRNLKIIKLEKCNSNVTKIDLQHFFSRHSLYAHIHTLKISNTPIKNLELNYFTSVNYLFLEGIQLNILEIPSTCNVSIVSLLYCNITDVKVNKYLDELKISSMANTKVICSEQINHLYLENLDFGLGIKIDCICHLLKIVEFNNINEISNKTKNQIEYQNLYLVGRKSKTNLDKKELTNLLKMSLSREIEELYLENLILPRDINNSYIKDFIKKYKIKKLELFNNDTKQLKIKEILEGCPRLDELLVNGEHHINRLFV